MACPARERLADGFGELGLLADGRELGAQPGVQVLDKRAALLQTHRVASFVILATDICLDGVERLDPLEGLRA